MFLTLGMGIELGPRDDRHHFGREPTGLARIECQVDNNWGVEYAHYSSIPDGAPFGGRDKNTVDVVSITYRIQLK